MSIATFKSKTFMIIYMYNNLHIRKIHNIIIGDNIKIIKTIRR